MTNEQLEALVAGLAVSQAKTEEVLRRSSEEAARQRAETEEAFRKHWEKRGAEQAKTDVAMQELSKQLGGLSNKFGSFTEGLALPSMSQILTEKFHAQVISPRVRALKGGKSLEIDVLAYSNGVHNSVFLVEVKSHLNEDALDQIKRQLADFPKFFPEHRAKELYGILAGVHVQDDVARRAIKAGIYVARISNEVFRLQVPVGFRPSSFKA